MENQVSDFKNIGPQLDPAEIPFTICFCRYVPENKILLIKRAKKPHLHKWNGLGGKLMQGETPEISVRREILEEADIDLNNATVHFAGIVTWTLRDKHELDQISREVKGGMYAYVADFTDSAVLFSDRETPEGLLGWKDFSFASDISSSEMADNVPHFLPAMLSVQNQNQKPKQFHCVYENGKLISVTEHNFVFESQIPKQHVTDSFQELVALSKLLHKECPWDAKQTIESFHQYIVGEALEVQKAAQEKDYDELKEELGDVFWNVMFMANIAEQNGLFTLHDVLTTSKEKMIRRHPHVFGDSSKDMDSIHKKWDEIKAKERVEKENRRNNI